VKSPLIIKRKGAELHIRVAGNSLERVPAFDVFLTVLFFIGLVVSVLLLYRDFILEHRASVIIFALAFLWAINRASRRERMIVRQHELELRYPCLFTSERHRFNLGDIRNFRFRTPQEETTGAAARRTQRLISDPAIVFHYHGKMVQFGAGLQSWEVDELEQLVADVSGYDLRYSGSGEYGAPAKPGIQVSLKGQWLGKYTHGESYGPRLAGTSAMFRIFIDHVEKSGFRGRCLDLEGVYAHLQPAEISGYADGAHIDFQKQYSYSSRLDINGRAVVDHTKPQLPVWYHGEYNAITGLISGTWEIAQILRILPNSQQERVLSGTWEARKDD
jgi:hypothetical protein